MSDSPNDSMPPFVAFLILSILGLACVLAVLAIAMRETMKAHPPKEVPHAERSGP